MILKENSINNLGIEQEIETGRAPNATGGGSVLLYRYFLIKNLNYSTNSLVLSSKTFTDLKVSYYSISELENCGDKDFNYFINQTYTTALYSDFKSIVSYTDDSTEWLYYFNENKKELILLYKYNSAYSNVECYVNYFDNSSILLKSNFSKFDANNIELKAINKININGQEVVIPSSTFISDIKIANNTLSLSIDRSEAYTLNNYDFTKFYKVYQYSNPATVVRITTDPYKYLTEAYPDGYQYPTTTIEDDYTFGIRQKDNYYFYYTNGDHTEGEVVIKYSDKKRIIDFSSKLNTIKNALQQWRNYNTYEMSVVRIKYENFHDYRASRTEFIDIKRGVINPENGHYIVKSTLYSDTYYLFNEQCILTKIISQYDGLVKLINNVKVTYHLVEIHGYSTPTSTPCYFTTLSNSSEGSKQQLANTSTLTSFGNLGWSYSLDNNVLTLETNATSSANKDINLLYKFYKKNEDKTSVIFDCDIKVNGDIYYTGELRKIQ